MIDRSSKRLTRSTPPTAIGLGARTRGQSETIIGESIRPGAVATTRSSSPRSARRSTRAKQKAQACLIAEAAGASLRGALPTDVIDLSVSH